MGAGSKGAGMFVNDPDAARQHALALHAAGRCAMIQPYLGRVDIDGETALVFVGGSYSHAARKAAILSQQMTWSTGIYADEKVLPTVPSPAERDLAERALDAVASLVPGGLPLTYARVDLLPGPEGPVVLEVELTEPSLFLRVDPEAPGRAAAAFRRLLR